ncbi:FIT family protein [Yarrowia sp. C11]|nr:FIT family protein [Yarrowia sp. E02]KAG5365090.1 FIT family protein [Yarrowia sp. C11]
MSKPQIVKQETITSPDGLTSTTTTVDSDGVTTTTSTCGTVSTTTVVGPDGTHTSSEGDAAFEASFPNLVKIPVGQPQESNGTTPINRRAANPSPSVRNNYKHPDLHTELTEKSLANGLFSILDLALIGLVFSVLILGALVGKIVDHTYFADKRNFLNILFVKNGWLWTTIAFGYIVYETFSGSIGLGASFGTNTSTGTRTGTTHDGVSETNSDSKSNAALKLLVGISAPTPIGQLSRYVIHSMWWLLFTQWFLGIPIMDRFFVATGGKCEYHKENASPITGKTISSASCRKSGGTWVGGYDPSGHCFLLVLSTLFLVYETIPHIKRRPYKLSSKIALGTAALWTWMYFMTSLYFHTFWEKLMGVIFGLLTVQIVYVVIPYLSRPKPSVASNN